MARQPFTLRQAVLAGAALASGSTVGTLVETITTTHYPGVGQLAAAATALWVLDKLNAPIDDTK